MTMRTALTIILGIFLLAQSSEAAKPELTDLSVSPNPAMAGGTVYVTVSKTGPKCGVLVDYGSGTHHFSAAAGAQQIEFVAPFPNPTTYTITAIGKKKGDHPLCEGTVPAVTLQVNPRPRAEKQPTLNISPIPPKPGLRENRRGLKPIPPKPTQQGAGTQDLFGILDVDVKAYGTVADFMIRLTDGAVATITATPLEAAPNPNPVTVTVRVKGQTIALTGLSPATNYKYKVIADGGGPLVSWEGTFRTQRRIVKFVVKEIHAVDDGDDTDEGDFIFAFYRGEQGSGGNQVHFEHGISTGTMVETNHSVTFPSIRENTLRMGSAIGEEDGHFGAHDGFSSGIHREKGFSFDWVRDRQSGGQQKDWSWAVSKSGDNAWHLLLKGHLRVSWAD